MKAEKASDSSRPQARAMCSDSGHSSEASADRCRAKTWMVAALEGRKRPVIPRWLRFAKEFRMACLANGIPSGPDRKRLWALARQDLHTLGLAIVREPSHWKRHVFHVEHARGAPTPGGSSPAPGPMREGGGRPTLTHSASTPHHAGPLTHSGTIVPRASKATKQQIVDSTHQQVDSTVHTQAQEYLRLCRMLGTEPVSSILDALSAL